MATDTASSIRTIRLSAKQLKQMTKLQGAQWNDELINEFLNYLINITNVAEAGDSVSEVVDSNTANISSNSILINNNASNIASNLSLINANSDEIAVNVANIAANALAISSITTSINDHIADNSAHGVTGVNIGSEDYATELVGGAVLAMALVADAVTSTAAVVFADIGAAPALYDAVYAQEQTDAINDLKSKHNALLLDLNAAITLFNELLASSKTAKQMTI
jgi:hypothetical protein